MLKTIFITGSLFASLLPFTSPLHGDDALVWEEQFSRYKQGTIIGQTRPAKPWYLDRGEGEEAAADYTVSEAPDGTPALAILKTQKLTRLGCSLKGNVAEEQSGNLLIITFSASVAVDAPLGIAIHGEQGGMLVANISLQPSGEVVLIEGKTGPTRKLLPLLWVPGEWNRLAVSVFPGSQKVRLRMLNASGEASGEVVAPLIREHADSLLPWWTIHFWRGAMADTPWFISSITLGSDPNTP